MGGGLAIVQSQVKIIGGLIEGNTAAQVYSLLSLRRDGSLIIFSVKMGGGIYATTSQISLDYVSINSNAAGTQVKSYSTLLYIETQWQGTNREAVFMSMEARQISHS